MTARAFFAAWGTGVLLMLLWHICVDLSFAQPIQSATVFRACLLIGLGCVCSLFWSERP